MMILLLFRWFFVVLLLLASPVYAGTVGGTFEFAKQTQSFGTVYQGQKLHHRFTFKNTGDAPLRLKGVYAACGCTVATFDREGVYAPGQEGGIDITFDSTRFSGKIAKVITVMTDERGIPERLLTVTANVIEEYQVTPPILDFGDITTSTGGTQKITVAPINGFPLTVTGAEYDSKIFEVLIKQDVKNWIVEVTMKKKQQSGFFRQDIYLLTNSTKLPKFQVPTRANVKGNIQYVPEYLEFGAIARDSSAKRLIKFDLQGGKFHIVQASTVLYINGNQIKDISSYLTTDILKGGNSIENLNVLINNKSEFSGSVHGTIQLETDDPMQKEIRVDLYAYFR